MRLPPPGRRPRAFAGPAARRSGGRILPPLLAAVPEPAPERPAPDAAPRIPDIAVSAPCPLGQAQGVSEGKPLCAGPLSSARLRLGPAAARCAEPGLPLAGSRNRTGNAKPPPPPLPQSAGSIAGRTDRRAPEGRPRRPRPPAAENARQPL